MSAGAKLQMPITPGVYRTTAANIIARVKARLDDDRCWTGALEHIDGEVFGPYHWENDGRPLNGSGPYSLIERVGDLPATAGADVQCDDATPFDDDAPNLKQATRADTLRERLLLAAFGGPVAQAALDTYSSVMFADDVGRALVRMVDAAIAELECTP